MMGKEDVRLESDSYDQMWDHTWRNTQVTTGHSTFSLQKSYFPKGKIIVALLDLIASYGFALAAATNFGGINTQDDDGGQTWPVFIFYREEGESMFAAQHLLFAVKHSNIPGKVCAAGPMGELEGDLTAVMV